MRYKTLAEFQQAIFAMPFDERPVLWLDNDDTGAYDEDAHEELFRMHPNELLNQALDLLGIPHEGV